VLPSFDLAGRVAVVTGGSRGIGRAIAQGLAESGADIVIASRKLESCERAAREIAASTGRATLGVACHVGDWDLCDALMTRSMSGSITAKSSSTMQACRHSMEIW
jgi:NAD(P)-dependent dehydrogenase (short-subunit alcohol dehydrogenase family)